MSSDVSLPTVHALTPAERRDLLWLARQSIRAALHAEAPPTCSTPTPALNEPTAAFVSLHQQRRLRGCIGTLAADRPLHETVVHMARSAAFEDPRFAPLIEAELPAIDIEISRLSPLVPVSPEDVCPGVHGVCLRYGDQRGVLLPQVALMYNWDRETLLAELCRKAMLPPDAWKLPEAALTVFVAEVFGEAVGETKT